jgi:hypothetical protein
MIYILPEAKMKLDAYVSLAKGEISGLGKVKKLKRGVLLIEDLFIFDQKCTPSETVLDRSVVADFMTDMISAGEDPSCIRLWWHSHADMKVSWSTTDESTIYGFNNEWMLSLVTNYGGDYLCRVDSFQPMQMTAYDVPLQVFLEMDVETLEMLRKEVEAKVKHTVPKVKYIKGGNLHGYVPTDGVDIFEVVEYSED